MHFCKKSEYELLAPHFPHLPSIKIKFLAQVQNPSTLTSLILHAGTQDP